MPKKGCTLVRSDSLRNLLPLVWLMYSEWGQRKKLHGNPLCVISPSTNAQPDYAGAKFGVILNHVFLSTHQPFISYQHQPPFRTRVLKKQVEGGMHKYLYI